MILRNPQALFLLLLLPLVFAAWRWRRGRVGAAALGLRLAAAALVIAALADPVAAASLQSRGTLVVLVDQSDSLGEAGQARLREQALAVRRANEQAGWDATHVLFFGKNTAVPVSATLSDAPPELQTDATDLAGALRAAGGLIGAGDGRVVLLSDGGQTRGDALREAEALARAGVPIDTLAFQTPDLLDSWVAAVDMPPTLRVGEEFTVQVAVGSVEAAGGELRLLDGTEVLAAQAVALAPGQNSFSFPGRASRAGILRLRAELVVAGDAVARNDQGAATALVAPPPLVLLVEGGNGGAAPLRVALRESGVQTEVITAGQVPRQLSDLDAYDGVVLIDVPAGDLTLDQMTTLREFVRSEGRGLIATGGRSSLTLGAYKDTPLEEALPVQMDPPPRPQRSDVTLLLIVDRSASMGGIGVSKFDMAKEAAILATESLRDEDRLGVLSFDTGHSWVVDFQQLGTGLSLAQIQERIGVLDMGGGTDIYAALEAGLPALARQPGQVRHAVILTDGRSFESGRDPYRRLIEQARAQDITLSAIAIGDDSDTQLLQNLAQWGAGRYHFAAAAEDIPRLTLLESEIARTEPQVEGEFRADLTAPHPALRDFPANTIPRLEGYVATTLKPDGELVLESPEGDPVLAAWQFGLGRAVAWTPSIEAPWAQDWANWPEYGQFWAQIIRYTLPEPDSGLTQVRVTPRGDEAVISVDSLEPGGTTLDLADTEATITLPDGTTRTIRLRQTAPGRYAESVALPADGPYAVAVRQTKDGQERLASAGYVQRYPGEYLPVVDGPELLQRISDDSGGTTLTDVGALAGDDTGRQPEQAGLAPWLLLMAALLWPLEIAVRRGWVRGFSGFSGRSG